MNQFRKQPSGLVGPPFLTMMLYSLSAQASHWPRAENSLMSECGLSNESARMAAIAVG